MLDQQTYHVIKDREQSAVAEAFRALRVNIVNALGDDRSLMFAGFCQGDGLAMTAVNTAAALSYAGNRVVLVEGDLRTPYLQTIFGLKGSSGLTNIIHNGLTLENAVQDSYIPRLSILPSGPLPEKPVETLSHPMFRELIDQLKARTDYVIFTSTPIVIVNRNILSDACVLAAKVDGVAVVADAEAVEVNAARKALALLKGARARILGSVFNDVRDDQSFVY